ncbi:MAG TPA: aminoglycoside phosphotransferase family protein [Terracidiphilus sp.]|nr:aminoglycoside phosphotransferase family protein [Terracidiphilus sp.]
MSERPDAYAAAGKFEFRGEILDLKPHGSGHINDTFLVTCQSAGATSRYVLQHINRHVFHDPVAVMQNIERVTAHLAKQAAGEPDSARRTLHLVPARDGLHWHIDAHGETWRAYRFIENARTYETATSTAQAYQAARAFGRFQQQLANLPPPRLNETIPDFHNTPKRVAALEAAIAADAASRVSLARPEIEFAQSRAAIAGVLFSANVPERITHNDTKFNNVLLDDKTGEAVCVIDLDTVMPGLAPYDFGDMVRTTTSPANEDEQDLSKVTMQFAMFEALVRGYLETAGAFLTGAEKELLAFSGKLITFEIGIRFLTDYLAGDTYFKVHREGHNLDRCRTQFKLVESIEQQEEKMNRLVTSLG